MSATHGLNSSGKTQNSSGVLQGGSNSASSVVVHFTQLVTLMLTVVPMNSILKVSATVMADIEDEDAEQQPEASTSNQSSGTLHAVAACQVLIYFMLTVCSHQACRSVHAACACRASEHV